MSKEIKYELMRKILSLAYLAIAIPSGFSQEEKQEIPGFRPAKVEPTTNVVAPATAVPRPPDGMASDLPVALDESVSLNKIYTFRNDRNQKPTGNPMLDYEKKYWDHGAILQKEIEGKQGNIFVVNWQNDGSPSDFTVRLDYRQANTRERVMTKTEEYKNFGGYEKTVIQVVGDDYLRGGVVNSWRISIVRDGKIVAQEKSFIW